MAYKIIIEPDASLDIQKAITWYNDQGKGLGRKFFSEVNSHFNLLKENPHFENRYDNVHCLPLKKHPYMVHFTIDEVKEIVSVRSVFHTSLNPKNWNR